MPTHSKLMTLELTHLTNLRHKILYYRTSSNACRPNNHSIWHRSSFPISSCFSRNFFISYFNNHGSQFHINSISLELIFSKSSDSFVKPAKQEYLQSLANSNETQDKKLLTFNSNQKEKGKTN